MVSPAPVFSFSDDGVSFVVESLGGLFPCPSLSLFIRSPVVGSHDLSSGGGCGGKSGEMRAGGGGGGRPSGGGGGRPNGGGKVTGAGGPGACCVPGLSLCEMEQALLH